METAVEFPRGLSFIHSHTMQLLFWSVHVLAFPGFCENLYVVLDYYVFYRWAFVFVFFFHLSLSCIINVFKTRLSESFPPSPGTAERPTVLVFVFCSVVLCC